MLSANARKSRLEAVSGKTEEHETGYQNEGIGAQPVGEDPIVYNT